MRSTRDELLIIIPARYRRKTMIRQNTSNLSSSRSITIFYYNLDLKKNNNFPQRRASHSAEDNTSERTGLFTVAVGVLE